MTTADLTDEQRDAVESRARHRVVIAGAGTGKTRVLSAALRDLIERGVPVHEIACVTFARAAAEELRRRIESEAPDQGRGVYVGTTHGLALDVLSAALGETPSLLTDDDCREIARGALGRLAGVSGVTVDHVMGAMLGTNRSPKAHRVADECRRVFNGAVPSFNLFRLAHGAVTDPWRDRCRYLFVDEAQDLAPDERGFLLALGPESSFVVGDPRQSIYTFRGGIGIVEPMITGLLMAPVDRGIFALTQSFRCPEPVARASHAFDTESEDRRIVGRTIDAPDVEFGEPAALFAFDRAITEGKSVAVLCRTRREADDVAACLPIGPNMFVERPPVKTRGNRLARMMVRAAANEGDPLVDRMELSRCLPGADIAAFIEGSRGRVVSVVAANVKATINGHMDEFDRREAWAYLDAMCQAGDTGGLMTATDWLLDEATSREAVAPPDAPYIGTMHGAKGREWDVVIVRMDRGFPHHRCDDAEERRLAYVAVTRARERLVIWYDADDSASPYVGEIREAIR